MTEQIKLYVGEVRTITVKVVSTDSDEDVVIREATSSYENIDDGLQCVGVGVCKIDGDEASRVLDTTRMRPGIYELIFTVTVGSETIVEKMNVLVEE